MRSKGFYPRVFSTSKFYFIQSGYDRKATHKLKHENVEHFFFMNGTVLNVIIFFNQADYFVNLIGFLGIIRPKQKLLTHRKRVLAKRAYMRQVFPSTNKRELHV